MAHPNSSFGHFLDGMADDPRAKREKIFKSFSDAFQKDFFKHAMSSQVFELLVRDTDHYEIIEFLLKQNIDIFRRFECAIQCLPNNHLFNELLKQKGLL